MKPGELAKLASVPNAETYETHFRELSKSTDLEYAKRDAAVVVENGAADVVYIVKVLAVVRRSARIEE